MVLAPGLASWVIRLQNIQKHAWYFPGGKLLDAYELASSLLVKLF
jgi:hypothetical protein